MIKTPQFQIMAIGAICAVALVLSEKILEFDLMLYRKWGLTKLHDTVSRNRSVWLFLLRLTLAAFLVGVLVALYVYE